MPDYCHTQVQCNQAREQNILKSLFWAKNHTDKPTCYQNGHNNQFYRVLQNCNFPIVYYIANTKAIHVRASFHAFFADFG